MIKQMYPAFFFGLGGPMGSGNQYLPWIHIKDLCNLLLFSIEQKQVVGILNGVAPQVSHFKNRNILLLLFFKIYPFIKILLIFESIKLRWIK